MNRDGLLPTAAEGGGSTILCWEGHALLEGNTILKQLAGKAITDKGGCDVQMTKGNVLYIFTKRENTGTGTDLPVQKYNLDIYRAITSEGSGKLVLGRFVWTRSYEVIEVPQNGEVEAFSTINSTEPKDASSMNFSL